MPDQERTNVSKGAPPVGVHSASGPTPEQMHPTHGEAAGVGAFDDRHEASSSYKDTAIAEQLLHKIAKSASDIITALPNGHAYHCLEHTQQVVANATTIADGIGMRGWDRTLLLMSAWLHDVGFRVRYMGHEIESCRIARELLSSEISEEDMRLIEAAIMATEIPQHPPHPIAQALCDADLLYLGTNEFSFWSNRLRVEHQAVLGKTYSDLAWTDFNIDFVENHAYFTDFACVHWGEHHAVNLTNLKLSRELLAKHS